MKGSKIGLVAVLGSAFATTAAGPLPVKNATDAIVIAKKVCGKLVLPTHQWQARLTGGQWDVLALPRSHGYGLSVEVAVKGPAPRHCMETLVQIAPSTSR